MRHFVTLIENRVHLIRVNPGHICKFCIRDTKNVSDFVQKHFVSATNVSQFAQPQKHHGQQCVRNNVSWFTRAL